MRDSLRRALRCLSFVPFLFAVAARAETPPNILLITLDTTRADRIGCYGYPGAVTPNIDGLARRGVRWSRAISPSPLTLPSHATMMTGRTPRELGVHDNSHTRLGEDALTLAEIFSSRSYRTSAFIASAVLDRSSGINQGFDTFDDHVRLGPREWFGWTERGASQTASAVIDNLPDGKKPFFLWVHFYDPHRPWVAPATASDKNELDPYDAEIAFVDREIGRILAAFRSRDLDENLIVAIAGDHGESLGEHGEDAHGVFIYQATQAIPMMLAGPGIPMNTVIDTNAGLVDLAPTLLTLAGIEIPDMMSGRSLLERESTDETSEGVLRWEPSKSPLRAYELESRYGELSFGWSPLYGVIRGRYKFIRAPEPELYDLKADSREETNLITLHGGIATSLQAWIDERFGPPPWELRTDQHASSSDVETDEVDGERLERLASLGYVSTKAPAASHAIDPKRGIAWTRSLAKARRLLSDDRGDEALPLLEAIVAENETHVPAWLTLGNARLAAGSTRAAIAAFEKAAELDERSHLPPFNLGRVWSAIALHPTSEHGAADRAVGYFQQALERHPRHADSVLRLAETLVARGDMEEAIRTLKDALAKDILDEEILVFHGRLEAHRGNMNAARRSFERALVQNPRSGVAWSDLGHLAYAEKQYHRAVEAYRRSLEVEPSAAAARTLGSILLEHIGDIDGAIHAYEISMDLEPKSPETKVIRAIVADLEQAKTEGSGRSR